MADGLLDGGADLFDYGCGRGTDVAGLVALGVRAAGWDPVHFPDQPKQSAAVVNLGYVLNVIERPDEREEVLIDAWTLASRVLVVAARLDWEPSAAAGRPHGDGILTAAGTFQKYYSHHELQSWINAALDVESTAAAPGVFYVFRDEACRQSFMAGRFVQRRPSVRLSPSVLLDGHREVLEPLIGFLTEHGRVPEPDELPNAAAIRATFGDLQRAYRIVARALGTSEWEGAALRRQRDLLVYVALSRFGRRPKFSDLPTPLKRDIKGLLGSYAAACRLGDSLLFSAGQRAAIDAECRASTIGKLTPDAIYVHLSALNELSPLLRVYEGCGRTLLGAVEGATIVKLRRDKAKISYLVYPDFDSAGHPILRETFVADLTRLRTYHRDYRASPNPPVLHRKETFVSGDYHARAQFLSLTKAEEEAGLLSNPEQIGFLNNWTERLRSRGVRVEGHRLTRVT